MNSDIRESTYNETLNNLQQRNIRDGILTNLVENYQQSTGSLLKFKKILRLVFSIVCIIILIVPVTMIAILSIHILDVPYEMYGSISWEVSSQILLGIIASMTSFVASIKYLPKIIAEYLFDVNESKYLAEIISLIQKYDNISTDN